MIGPGFGQQAAMGGNDEIRGHFQKWFGFLIVFGLEQTYTHLIHGEHDLLGLVLSWFGSRVLVWIL